MKKTIEIQIVNPLDELCASVRRLVAEGDFKGCERLIYKAMEEYPHAPHPHNLLGIVLEKTGEHSLAMRHFRAAWALDPAYRPANHNLENYGTFNSRMGCAFDESDVPVSIPSRFTATRDEREGAQKAMH